MSDNLRYLFYPADRLLEVIGVDDGPLRGSRDRSANPSLARRWFDVRNGRQKWVSVAVADAMLTLTGHHEWELGMDPVPAGSSLLLDKGGVIA